MARWAASRPAGALLGRLYFAIQALAGAGWWLAVFTNPFVRNVTLGELPPLAIAAADIPLFVIGSGLVAAGVRGAVWIVVPWTFAVTGGLALYATLTTQAGWGVVFMAAASAGGFAAGMLVLFGRIPAEAFMVGPFAFRNARPASRGTHMIVTAGQLAIFWGFFLGIMPLAILVLEVRWRLHVPMPAAVVVVGIVIFAVASALGFWSACATSSRGEGTPLPSVATSRLVVAGPYRYVRNPMAMAGLIQGAAVGLIAQSWLVLVYAVVGSVIWNWFVRPLEEADLAEKFGDDFLSYKSRVRCWLPTFGQT